uniref:Uncharacterized protein n=1 Tax=Brassica oleracea var. oleracea TaxID=109376 RepID=A0A0D3DJI8_BRAOL
MKFFFFVCVNAAFVEENYIPLFWSKPNDSPFINPLYPFPEDVIEMRDLLRNGPFFWTFFMPRRVRKALRLLHPDLGVGVEADKGKGIDLGDIEFSVDDSILPGWDPYLAYGDGSGSSEVPILDFDEFFAGLPSSFDPPSSKDELGRSKVVAEGSRIINAGLNMLDSALETKRDSKLAKDHDKAVRRAERRGRREVVEVVRNRTSQLKAEYGNLKEAYSLVGDFRECRGSVGTLWRTRESDYTFDSELKSSMGFMGDCEHADLLVPLVKGRIQELWDPIPVSPDTEEAATDFAGEGGEVDQPESTFGASMSEIFEVDWFG